MKNIRLYKEEEIYHNEKTSFEFPTVSYTRNTDKVWYMKNNQIKMMFSITEDDVNYYRGTDLMVWENSILFDSVKVNGVEQKKNRQEKNIIITGESTEAVVLDITLENSVTQGEVVVPQPMSMTIEEDGNSSSDLPYIINITDENKLPYSSGKITVKLTNTSLNNLSYLPSFYVKYTSTIDVEDMIERTEYALLDWGTAYESFSIQVNDDGTEMTLTLPPSINITHLFIVPMDSRMEGSAVPLEPEVEGIHLDENYLLYSYETNNIILPCQLICGGGFMFDESCSIDDECIKKCDLIFNEPLSEEKLISDADKYYITMSFQVYQDGAWYNPFNFTQPLSVLIENDATDCFIINEKPELVGLDLYYYTEGLVNELGPTARMLVYVVYDENAVYNEETENFIVNVNEDTLVGSQIHLILDGMPLLYLPTIQEKDYEVVVSKYWNLNDIANMSNMFASCHQLTSIDFSDFDASNVTNMYRMFYECRNLTSVTFGDNFNTSNVTNMSSMFQYCYALTSLDLSSFDTSNVTNMSNMFNYCYKLTSLDVSNFDTSNVTNMYYMFYDCSSLTSLDLSSFDVSNVTDVLNIFWSPSSLRFFKYFKKTPPKALELSDLRMTAALTTVDFSAWDTSNVTSMYSLCGACRQLTEVNFGDNFNTSNVSNMQQMFYNCSGLTSLDLSSFDTSNVTDMSVMFEGCRGLTSLDLSSFDTSNVTDMLYMFSGCTNLISLDLSSFDTNNVTNMAAMFNECRSLTSITFGNNFNTSHATNMARMFDGCWELTSLDLSNFNTSNLRNMSMMFYYCTSLTSVTFGSQADVSEVTSYTSMFSGVTTTGILYYPQAYTDGWNNILVTQKSTSKFPSTWTVTAVDYENGETVPIKRETVE